MIIRPRRLRKTESIRNLICETKLTPSMLVYPIFVREGKNIIEDIPAMPGQKRYSPDNLNLILDRVNKNKIGGVLLFGIPDENKKDEIGSASWDENGPVQQAIKFIKREYPEIIIFADVCLCEYTNHGHCGVINKFNHEIENDPTLEFLTRSAVSYAQAGADVVAPSDMMDGHTKAIREGLDKNNFYNTLICSYAVKYASGFYGPFREAAGSAPSFGDRKTYQMDIRNSREALREAFLDVEEGADIIIIKPGISYLDILKTVREKILIPIASYQVSGEYSMIKAAGLKGWIDEKKIISETAISIARAGADIIITYFANELAELIHEGGL